MKVKIVDKMMQSAYNILYVKHRKIPYFLGVLTWFLILDKI